MDDKEPNAAVVTPPKKRKLSLPDYAQQYIICVVFRLAWPGLPLTFEYLIAGAISAKSIALTGFMYTVALGVASRNLALLLLSLAGGLICGVFFGLASGQGLGRAAYRLTIGIMALTFFVHAIDRFNRHWIDGESFIEFGPKGN
ncbi:MAG: hypothetical protein ACREBG_08130 [Pyrinomonadaceae bacterium]